MTNQNSTKKKSVSASDCGVSDSEPAIDQVYDYLLTHQHQYHDIPEINLDTCKSNDFKNDSVESYRSFHVTSVKPVSVAVDEFTRMVFVDLAFSNNNGTYNTSNIKKTAHNYNDE